MTTIKFHHAGLAVPDLEKAIQFYCGVFGFTILQRINWDSTQVEWPVKVTGVANSMVKGVQLQGDNGFLELFEWIQPESTGKPTQAHQFGITHLAFQVQNINQVYEQFIAHGGTSHGKPSPVGKAIAIYCQDPFGNLIELLQIVKEDAPFDLRRLGN